MFDHQIQKFTQKPLIVVAKIFLKFVNPNQITILGFILGISMSFLIFFHFYFYAILLLILSRLCDGLDGTMARLTTPLLWWILRYCQWLHLFWVCFAFGFSNSSYTTLSIFYFLYIGTGTTFLAKAAIQTQLDKISETNDAIEGLPKSFHYTSGLVEGTETIIFMVCVSYFHFYFNIYYFWDLCFITLFLGLLFVTLN